MWIPELVNSIKSRPSQIAQVAIVAPSRRLSFPIAEDDDLVDDKDEIKKTIKEENLSVYFEWYPYIEAEEALLEAGYLNLESEDEESDGSEEDEN